MDANKLKVLQQIGYEVKRCCGNCFHSSIRGDAWGVCELHTYKHLKHSEEESFLSVHAFGTCKLHKFEEGYLSIIHGFSEFVK